MKKESIPNRLRAWLNDIPIHDPIERRMAALLQVMLIGFIAIIILASVLNLVIPPAMAWQVITIRSAVFLLILGIPLGLLRRGHFHSSAVVIIAIFFILETIAVAPGNLREVAETLPFYTLAILLAGLLVGRRALAITFMLSAGAVVFSAVHGQAAGLGEDGIVIASNFILLNGLMSVFIDRFGVALRAALTAALERGGELQNEVNERRRIVEALRESEGRYRKLIDTARDVIFTISTDGTFTSLNPSFETFTGWSRVEWLGRSFDDLIAEADRPRAHELFGRVLRAESLRAIRLHVHTRDGKMLVVELNLSPQIRDGQVVGLLGIARDMTEEQRAEDALRESEEKYRNLVERLPTVIYTAGLGAHGRWSYVSPQIESLLGFTPEEWMADPTLWYRQIHPEDRDRQVELEAQAWEQSELFDSEYRIFRSDGRQIWVRDTAQILLMQDGEPVVQGALMDITGRKRIEAALGESEARYRALKEQSVEAIYMYDAETKHIVEANPAFLTLLGYTTQEARALTQYDIVAHSRESVDTYSRQLFAKGVLDIGARQWRRKDGTLVDVEVTAGKLRQGEKDIVFAVARDITRRKRAEDALQASEERYRAIYENSTIGMYRTTPGGEILLCNPALLHLLGYDSFEELAQVNLEQEGYAPGYKRSDFRQRVESEGQVLGYESAWTRKDGSTLFVRESARVVRDAGGKILYYEGTVEDVTERKLAEEARQQTIVRLQREVDVVAAVAASAKLAEGAVQELAVELTEAASGALGIERVNVWLFEGDETRLVNIDNYVASTGKHSSGAVLLEREFQNEFAALKSAKYVDAHDPLTDPRTTGYVEGYLKPNRITSMLDGVIRSAGRNLGLLCFEHVDKPHHWENDEITFVCQLADQVALAISNRERRQAEEEIHKRAETMTALYKTTQDLVIERDLPTLLQTIVERAARLLHAKGGGLYLCEPENGQVRCVVSYNTPRDYTGTILKYGEGAAGLVAETGDSLIIDDYRTWQGRAVVYEKDHPFVSLICVPIRWQDQTIGVLHVLENSRPSAFVQEDLRVLTLFANQAAIAIENARLLEAEQRRRKEADAIAEIGRDISATLDLDIVLERIASHAKDLLGAETSAVYLYEPSRSTLRAIVAIGPDAEEIKGDPLTIGEGILGNIAMQKSGEIVNDTVADPRTIIVKGTEVNLLEHLMGVPVLSENQLTGLIAVWRTGAELEFKPTELDFLSRLAGQVAVAIQNARLFEAEQKRRQEANTLRQAAQRITSILDQEQAIRLILEQLARVVLFEGASVQLLRDGYLEIVGGQGWPDPSAVLGMRFSIPGDNPNSIVVLERRPVVLGNASEVYSAFTTPPHTHIQSWLGVPLTVRDRVIGMFAVDHSQPDFFSDEDVQMVNAFAGQAAIAIENARLFEETERRLREAEAIGQVGIVLSQTLDLEPLLENILKTVILAIPAAERGSTLLVDEEGNLRIRAVWGYADPRVLGFSFPSNKGYAALCFREQRALIIPDVRADAVIRYNGDIPEMLTGGSAMAAPMIVKDRVIGVMALDTPTHENAFNDDDLYLLKTIGSSTALAVENARLFENTRRRLAEIEAVHTVSTALRSARTLAEALPIILDQLIDLMDAGSALVDLLDPSSEEIVTELAHGTWAPMTGKRTPRDAGGSGRVISTGQPYVSNDLLADRLVAHPNLLGGLNAAACVPVIAQHQPIGTLWIGRQAPILEEEVSLLAAIGEMVGNAIHRMRLHEQTERLFHDLQTSNLELSKAYDTTLEGWAKALELRDKETEGHSRRVTDLTLSLARRLGVPESELTHIRRGVLLHDIGKMGVSDQILKKTGPLDDEEWDEMRKHPQYAYDLIHPITYLLPALAIPYCHHERWNGSGYPRGLKAEKIPLAARIFAVVDVWDALINDRPYRKAWTEEETLSYIREQSGILFDPEVVAKFLEVIVRHGRS